MKYSQFSNAGHQNLKCQASSYLTIIRVSNIESLNIIMFEKVIKYLLLRECFYSVNEYYDNNSENVWIISAFETCPIVTLLCLRRSINYYYSQYCISICRTFARNELDSVLYIGNWTFNMVIKWIFSSIFSIEKAIQNLKSIKRFAR